MRDPKLAHILVLYRSEKGFKFHAQPQPGAYSCSDLED